MREIKFRAWDKKGKGFVNGFNMIGFCTGQGAPRRKLQRFNVEWDIDAVIIEQFTGLKDKNGTPIYEGDIIEYKSGIIPRRTIIEFEIHWYNAGFYPKEGANAYHYWEVIGNIHENPELMNQKNESKNP